jgi:hypothetical protein
MVRRETALCLTSSDPLRLLDHLTTNPGSSQLQAHHQTSNNVLGRTVDAVKSSTAGSTSKQQLGVNADSISNLSRRRSMRTERRRETFARVLRGREGPGAGVDIGE